MIAVGITDLVLDREYWAVILIKGIDIIEPSEASLASSKFHHVWRVLVHKGYEPM
jgi:hypothetical protein